VNLTIKGEFYLGVLGQKEDEGEDPFAEMDSWVLREIGSRGPIGWTKLSNTTKCSLVALEDSLERLYVRDLIEGTFDR
jgi:hypothetical protein